MTHRARRSFSAALLLGLLVIAFTATWLAANGEPPCGWGIFHP